MENWKTIEGFEMYSVSNLGRIKRVVGGKGARANRIMNLPLHRQGYPQVGLRKEGKQYFRLVHVLVAKAFIPNPEELPEVNHKGPKSDCRATELEWVSKKSNIMDSVVRNLRGDGIWWSKPKKKWVASYNPSPNAPRYIGSYVTKEEAKAARDKAVTTLSKGASV